MKVSSWFGKMDRASVEPSVSDSGQIFFVCLFLPILSSEKKGMRVLGKMCLVELES